MSESHSFLPSDFGRSDRTSLWLCGSKKLRARRRFVVMTPFKSQANLSFRTIKHNDSAAIRQLARQVHHGADEDKFISGKNDSSISI